MALASVNNQKRNIRSGLAAAIPTSDLYYGDTYYATDTSTWYIYCPSGWVEESSGTAALLAGEAHIGEVGGNTFLVVVTPAVGAGAFDANDIVGGKLTLSNATRVAGGSGIWYSLILVDSAKQNAELELFLFNADLTVAGDNTPEATSAADLLKLVGHKIIYNSDYITLANGSVVSTLVNIPYRLSAGTTMYAFIRCTGTPTYTASCLQLIFGMLRD